MTPASFQPAMRGDSDRHRTVSQSTETNMAVDTATVGKLLQNKSGDIFSLRPNDTIATAVKILRDRKIGALVVTDQNGNLAGILSERDIVRKLAQTPGQTLPQTVEENMTTKVQTCASSDTLVDVLRRMSAGQFRHMPVVNDGKLAGMVTIGDVVHFRLSELEHEALKMKQLIVG